MQVEIYGDALRDLLAAAPRGGELSIQRSADKGFHVAGAACQRVDTAQDLQRLIDAGVACRVSATRNAANTLTPPASLQTL